MPWVLTHWATVSSLTGLCVFPSSICVNKQGGRREAAGTACEPGGGSTIAPCLQPLPDQACITHSYGQVPKKGRCLQGEGPKDVGLPGHRALPRPQQLPQPAPRCGPLAAALGPAHK